MTDQPDSGRPHPPTEAALPGSTETPVDPAYAAGAGFTGDATAAAPADTSATAGPDPLGSNAAGHGAPHALPERPAVGGGGGYGGDAGASGAAGPLGDTDDRTMAIIAHAANIAGPFTGGLGNLVALILAYIKKDTAPEHLRSHFVFAIRTVWIALLAAVVLTVLAIVAVPLSFIGIGLLIFPLVGLGFVAVSIWIIVRSIVALMKVLENRPYPTPESYLL